MKYLILLTLINFSLIITGCDNSLCEFTYELKHCNTNEIKTIIFQSSCSCHLKIGTYKEAVPIVYTNCDTEYREFALNYCDYRLINKTIIKAN